MLKVGERAGDRDVGERQPVADQIAVVRPAPPSRDNRGSAEARRARALSAASWSPGRFRKRGATIRLKNIFAPQAGEDRVGELVEPDDLAAQLRIGRDQRRLGMLGLEIMDDRARIGEAIVAVDERRHLPERAGRAEVRVRVSETGSGPLKVELDALSRRRRRAPCGRTATARNRRKSLDPPPAAGGLASRSGSKRRAGRARASAPACRPAPASPARVSASRMPSPAQTTRHKMSDRPGPALSIACVEAAAGIDLAGRWVRARRRPAAPAGDRRGIPGHGHARRELGPLPIHPQPLAGVELDAGVTRPRANSQPSGDSARLTVTDRTARSGRCAPPSVADFRAAVSLVLLPFQLLPRLDSPGLPHRQNCRTEEKPFWFVLGEQYDHADPRSPPGPRHDPGRRRARLRSADHAADHRPARDRHPHRLGRLAQPHRRCARRRSVRPGRRSGERADLAVAAILGASGASAPKRDGAGRPAAGQGRPGRGHGLGQRRRLSRRRRDLVRHACSRTTSPTRSTATCWCRGPPAASCSAA